MVSLGDLDKMTRSLAISRKADVSPVNISVFSC